MQLKNLGKIRAIADDRSLDRYTVVPLSRFRLHCGERFRYEYDFTAERHCSAMAECNRNETLRSTGAAWSALSGSLDPSIISDETQGRQFPRLPRRPIRHFGVMR
jgi:hypothetical protein